MPRSGLRAGSDGGRYTGRTGPWMGFWGGSLLLPQSAPPAPPLLPQGWGSKSQLFLAVKVLSPPTPPAFEHSSIYWRIFATHLPQDRRNNFLSSRGGVPPKVGEMGEMKVSQLKTARKCSPRGGGDWGSGWGRLGERHPPAPERRNPQPPRWRPGVPKVTRGHEVSPARSGLRRRRCRLRRCRRH